MKQITLREGDLELSSILREDAAALLPIINDVATQRYLPHLCGLLNEENGIAILIEAFDKYSEEGSGFLLGVRKDNMLIGFIAVMDIPIRPSIFYAMHPIYRNKGYMTLSVGKVIEHLSNHQICSFLQTYISPNNIASKKLLLKLGFNLIEENKAENMHTYGKQIVPNA